MRWSHLPPGKRALARAGIFVLVILVISVIWNLRDDEVGPVLRARDLLMAAVGAAIYAGIMFVVDRRLLRRGRRSPENPGGDA